MANLLFASRESDSLRSENPGRSQPSRGLVLQGLLAANPANSLRALALMQPAPIIVRMVRVGKARELERAARQAEAVIARDPLLAGVEEAHAKQLAIVLV